MEGTTNHHHCPHANHLHSSRLPPSNHHKTPATTKPTHHSHRSTIVNPLIRKTTTVSVVAGEAPSIRLPPYTTSSTSFTISLNHTKPLSPPSPNSSLRKPPLTTPFPKHPNIPCLPISSHDQQLTTTEPPFTTTHQPNRHRTPTTHRETPQPPNHRSRIHPPNPHHRSRIHRRSRLQKPKQRRGYKIAREARFGGSRSREREREARFS